MFISVENHFRLIQRLFFLLLLNNIYSRYTNSKNNFMNVDLFKAKIVLEIESTTY